MRGLHETDAALTIEGLTRVARKAADSRIKSEMAVDADWLILLGKLRWRENLVGVRNGLKLLCLAGRAGAH